MNKIILTIGLLFAAGLFTNATAATPTPALVEAVAQDTSLYRKGDFSARTIFTVDVADFDARTGTLGGGLAVQYHVTDAFAVAPYGIWQGAVPTGQGPCYPLANHVIGIAGVDIKAYMLAIERTGLAPYVLIGYSHDFNLASDNMSAGVGLEWRLGRRWLAAVDGRWVYDWARAGHARFTASVGYTF